MAADIYQTMNRHFESFMFIFIFSSHQIVASTIGVTSLYDVVTDEEPKSSFPTERTASSGTDSSPSPMTDDDDSNSDGSFQWQYLLIGILAFLNALAVIQLLIRLCCNKCCTRGLESRGCYRCLYCLKSIGCLIYQRPSIIVTQCSRLSTSNVVVDIKCPGFPDPDKVNINYFFKGKKIGKTSYYSSNTRHELHYDTEDEWKGFIVAKAKDNYGYTAETQFLIPEVPNVPWWQSKLQETYHRRKQRLRFLDSRREAANTDDLFKELTFENKRGDVITSYGDLFNLKNSDKRLCRNILLIGRSGAGKTTLMNQLTYRWSNVMSGTMSSPDSDPSHSQSSHQVLKRFKLVFLLNLRDYKDGFDLYQLIEDQLVKQVPKEKQDEFPETINRLGLECLFLLDGYDEISNQVKKDVQLLILNSSF
ncbi:uncharacterized protein [Amphiura filiformis]|uniref:uncharacterized protein n=1 Tax=Amphiura filiformis TaxID=82378 RepID=UPI003B210BC1